MKRLLTATVCWVIATGAVFADTPLAQLDEKHRAFLREHCVECHGEKKQKGKLRLDDVSFALDSVEKADRWQKVLNQINSGDMPPEDAKQPEPNAKADFLEALSQTLVTARRTLGDSGGKIVVRRLNRREYANTIRDLLGVEIDVSALPPDTGNGTFDTVGSSLFMSSDEVEQYLALGRRALDDAFALHSAGTKPRKLHTELEKVADVQLHGAIDYLTKKVEPYHQWTAAVDTASALPENQTKAAEIRALDEVTKDLQRFYRHWAELKDAPSPVKFGFKDAAEGEGVKQNFDEQSAKVTKYFALPHVDTGSYLFVFILRPQESVVAPKDWPPGEYALRVRMAALDDTPAERHFIEVGHPTQPGAFDILSTHQITGRIEQPKTIEIPVTLTSTGSRTFAIREKRQNSREQEVAIAVLYRNKHKTWYPPAMWIDWMELEGPRAEEGPQAKAPELFAAKHASVSEHDHARQIIERFVSRAFRGSEPDERFVEGLSRLFERRRSAGETFESALKEALGVVLAAPGFLYLSEPSEPGKPRTLSNSELATRLSYFLWSAPPDESLLAANLAEPDRLVREVDRLIASPKSRAFVSAFVQQWLGLDRLNFFQFNARDFPEFDDSLKAAARSGVIETFAHLLRDHGSLTQLLASDEVTVNGLLAQFYGIDGVRGDGWQTVKVPADSPRGGLLGMSAILAMGSNGERTSPVERGAWVLRKLLHDPPPPAPPNVPQLSRLADKALSPRERILAHQEQPQCANCHRKIDPIGFGLENFDAIGRWRTTETYVKQPGGRKPWPIDASGSFHKGPAFRDYSELRAQIATHRGAFARGFTEALIEYALGRPFGFIDEPLADAITAEARATGGSVASYLHALVRSDAFRTKR